MSGGATNGTNGKSIHVPATALEAFTKAVGVKTTAIPNGSAHEVADMVASVATIPQADRWYFSGAAKNGTARAHYVDERRRPIGVCGIILPKPNLWIIHEHLGAVPLCGNCQRIVPSSPSPRKTT